MTAQHATHCVRCGKEIPTSRTTHQSTPVKYCSRVCCASATKEKYRQQTGRSEWEKISPGKSGAVSELVVSADLLTRGYEVFRAVAQDGSCDMIILKNGSLQRVEVRTGYKTDDGKIKATTTRLDPKKYDVLAIVIAGREICYHPDIASIVS